MQLVLIAIFAVKDDGGIIHTIGEWLSQGGFGSGSYYVWIYFQFAVLLPICAMIIKRTHGKKRFLFFVVVCQLSELLFSVTGISNGTYRLVCLRYFFLIYLGYTIVEKGVIANKKSVLLALLSIMAILVFYYSDMDLRPIFFTNVSYSWRAFHWISYFYIAYLLIFQLYYINIKNKPSLNSMIEFLGKNSYEIILFQMFYFALFQYGTIPFLQDFGHNLSRVFYIVISSTICIVTIPIYILIKRKAKENCDK